ncbi:hypothetical protein VNO77_33889 [Canavalia gladiata]|uniref:Uncharacterized protein n=1 Tax=Canavalia gladiata TaxID=3824 RepID=A0AAN9Q183_CANGL
MNHIFQAHGDEGIKDPNKAYKALTTLGGQNKWRFELALTHKNCLWYTQFRSRCSILIRWCPADGCNNVKPRSVAGSL